MKSNTKTDVNEKEDIQNAPLVPSWRFTLGIMGLFGGIVMNVMRNNLSVGIVCMTIDPPSENNTAGNETLQGGSSLVSILFPNYRRSQPKSFLNDDECTNILSTDSSFGETGEFEWSDDIQGVILSSFSYGYIATQVLGGYLAGRFGAKKILFLGGTVATVCTLLGPLASIATPYLLITTQVLNGFGQGVYFPCFYELWSRWAPPFERTKLINLLLMGNSLGTIISLFMSGYLCEYVGWESLFYVYGGMGVLWLAAWLVLVYDSPKQHPWISSLERQYIEKTLARTGTLEREVLTLRNIPWFGMLTSKNLWMICVTAICSGFGYNMAQKMLPQFMEDVLQQPISENGLYSSIPHMATVLTTFSAAAIADLLITRGMIVIRVRKLMTCLSSFGSVIFTVSVGFLTCNDLELSIFCLSAWMAMTGFSRAGAPVAIVELFPRYAALGMGVVNTFRNIPGMIIPSIVAEMTPTGSQSEWRMVFFLTAGIYAVGGFSWLILGGGEVEEWAKRPAGRGKATGDEVKAEINSGFELNEKIKLENDATDQTRL